MIRKARQKLTDQIRVGEKGQVVGYINLYNYLFLRKHDQIFREFTIFTLDGIAMVLVLRLLGIKKVERKSPDFSSYFEQVFGHLNASKGKLLAVGGTPEDIIKFKRIVGRMFPDIQRVNFLSGYEDLSEEVLFRIGQFNPDVIILGMGTPKQELFALRLKEEGVEGTVYCCGAFISQTANTDGKYFPWWITKLHLRWAYRIYKEPHLIKRYAIDYPRGLIALLRDYIAWPRV